jgi:DNA-binding GntR family transcriptional regulator
MKKHVSKAFKLPENVSPLVPTLAGQIIDIIRREGLVVGARLTELALSKELAVSRSPVRKALQFLETVGAVTSTPNKGFQVAQSAADLGAFSVPTPSESDEAIYLRVADDRVSSAIGENITENDLIARYCVSRLQVQRVLNRMARERIIERKPGRGWAFLPLFTTMDSYRESFRFRMILEPAAILEPGYKVDESELDKCYREQSELLAGGIERWSRSELFRTGVHLHETIAAGANNRFLQDALRNVNQLRRLVDYRSKADRAGTITYMRSQCTEHLMLIDLLRRGERVEAAHFLREHLNGAVRRKSELLDATETSIAAIRKPLSGNED